MHIHPNYSINFDAMEWNRDATHELAARRAAEVRRRLAAFESTPAADEYKGSSAKGSRGHSDATGDAYSTADGEQIAAAPTPEPEISAGRDHGSIFSAVA